MKYSGFVKLNYGEYVQFYRTRKEAVESCIGTSANKNNFLILQATLDYTKPSESEHSRVEK